MALLVSLAITYIYKFQCLNSIPIYFSLMSQSNAGQ